LLGSRDIDAELVESFDKRAGLRRPAEQADAAIVSNLLDEDLRMVGVDS
jgi:hypothetical protein